MKGNCRFASTYDIYSFLFVFICIGINVNVCNGTVIINPTDTTTVEGETITLQCEFEIPKGATEKCFWMKDGTIINIDNFTGVYVWIGDSTKGKCSLQIVGVANNRDDGVWACQIPMSRDYAGDTSRPANLNVYVKPSPPAIYYGQSVIPPFGKITANQNDTVDVRCVSRYGNPPAKLIWSLDNVRLDSDKDDTSSEEDRKKTFKRTVQLLRNFGQSNSGKILRCTLKHETMNISTVYEVLMDIQYSTTTIDVNVPSYIEVDEGHGIILPCIADGNPPAKCEWMMKKDRDKQWTIKTEQCEYNLESVDEDDKGQYMCLAGNGQLLPSKEITIMLRSSKNDISGIIGAIIAGVFLIVLIILGVVVYFLRRKVIKENKDLPTKENLDRASTRKLYIERADEEPKYMIPLPTEDAPLNPPRDFELRYSKNGSPFRRKRESSHIYSDPHIYENIPGNTKSIQDNDDNNDDGGDGYIEI